MAAFNYKSHYVQVLATIVEGGHQWIVLINGHSVGTPSERGKVYPTAQHAMDAGLAFAKATIEAILSQPAVN